MNLKIEKIKELLLLLDEKEDTLLIYMLKAITTKNEVEYLSKHSITPKEIARAEVGLRRTVGDFISREDKYSIKIDKIIHRTANCSNCKYSIDIRYESVHLGNEYCGTYKNKDNTDRCDRCDKKGCKLFDIMEKRAEENSRSISKTFENNKELIEMKTIINKINYKLKNKRNYATS